MTKANVPKIIFKHYMNLSNALKLNRDEIVMLLTKEEIKELHSITILAYYHLTGEELETDPYSYGGTKE